MRPLDASKTYSDLRPLIYFEDLTPEQINQLMTNKYFTVEKIIGGRISPESRANRSNLDHGPANHRKRIC